MLAREQGNDSVVGSMFDKKAEEGAEVAEEEVAEGDKKRKAGKYFNEDDPDLKLQVIPEEFKEEFENLFIPEVIANDKIIFYKVPKLGSMYLLKCALRNYFDEASVDTAISENKY